MYPLLVSLMEEREREHARRNRHAWKRPEPKRESPVQWAIAAAATLRLNKLLHQHMTWEPMTPADAQGVLRQEPPAIGSVKGESRRYVEAWMVQGGASSARIKAVLELLGGYPA